MGWAFVIYRAWRTIASLGRLPRAAPGDRTTKVTAVVAARNEAGIIERAVRSLLSQEGVDINVVVVDDASEDNTHERLLRLADADERLLVLQSEKLPAGWVAKNYALELGQGRADGEYILFTDADVIHSRRAVAHAVAAMEFQHLDHLALHPRLEASTLVEAVVLPLFFLLTEFRFFDRRSVEPDSGVGAGIGAFNLVRAESYRLRGTHARIRGAVLDDRALGRMMRDDGGRGTVMRAGTEVRMRPFRSVREMYLGIKKGVLSSFGHSSVVAAAMGLLLLAAVGAPLMTLASVGPLIYFGHIPWAAIPAIAALIAPAVALLRARSMVRFEPLAAILYPVGAAVLGVAALHAALVFAVRGTVSWRGRHYRKADLRESGY